MVANLIAAYRTRIANLTWMSVDTKKKALAKLDALIIGVGYPNKWIDYSTLEIVRSDAFGNMHRAEAFNRLHNLEKLQQAADPAEWRIDPQVVGAVIVFSPNSEFFRPASCRLLISTAKGTTPPTMAPLVPASPMRSAIASMNSATSTTPKADSVVGGPRKTRRSTTLPRLSSWRNLAGTAHFPICVSMASKSSMKISLTWQGW
jgi:hypothetical protein